MVAEIQFGYACVSELTHRTTNHTCMLKSATPSRLRELITQNLDDLGAILEHNVANNWRLFRIGSSVIPFASHPINKLKWWDEFAASLARIGKLAKSNCLRLSMHPGQFTVLNSANPKTYQATVAELAYSARILDALGLNAEHKIVIHIGGTYDDKRAAMQRFVARVNELLDLVRRRLVIENDECCYTVADAVSISDACGLPVVFDNLHNRVNPSGEISELLPRVFRSWRKRDGKPKVHFSSQARNAPRGKHADWASPAEFAKMLAVWQSFGEFDVMLEAKRKDAALDRVLKRIRKS